MQKQANLAPLTSDRNLEVCDENCPEDEGCDDEDLPSDLISPSYFYSNE
jgi:hypothetical protein